jgi:RNA polymerase sigma factor (sigma-70 family)
MSCRDRARCAQVTVASWMWECDEDSCHTIVSLKRVKSVFTDDDVNHRLMMNGEEEPLVSAPEPFDAFYRREIRRLVGLAYALSGSRLAADDLAQEAMLAAYKNWAQVGRLENPGGWVRRVVSNQAVSAVRRRVSEAKGLGRLAIRHPVVDVPEISADSEWIWREVRRLPRRQIQVIALRYYDQLSMAEIAEVLDCSKETVNTHLRRARQTLDRRLQYRGDKI